MTITGDDLLNLAISFVAGVLVAIFTFGVIWRTRDRQFARAGALAQLEASPAIDDAARAELSNRIREEVDDLLHGDSTRRAQQVQQTLYVVLGVVALSLVWFAGDAGHPLWQRVLAGVAAALGFLLAVGITNVPAYRWRMPRSLMSYSSPGRNGQLPSSRLGSWALENLDIKLGDHVLLVGGGSAALTTVRAAVGEKGIVTFIDSRLGRADRVRGYVELRRWRNVDVMCGELGNETLASVPSGESHRLPIVDAAIVLDQTLGAKGEALSDTSHRWRKLFDCLSDDAVAFVLTRQLRKGQVALAEIALTALRDVFGEGARALRSGKRSEVIFVLISKNPRRLQPLLEKYRRPSSPRQTSGALPHRM